MRLKHREGFRVARVEFPLEMLPKVKEMLLKGGFTVEVWSPDW